MKFFSPILLFCFYFTNLHGVEFTIERYKDHHKNSETVHIFKNKERKNKRGWTTFAKQILGSYGACYTTKLLYRALALSNPNLADCALVQLLFCYLAVSASDETQEFLTNDSSFLALVLGGIFALSTGTPAEIYQQLIKKSSRRF